MEYDDIEQADGPEAATPRGEPASETPAPAPRGGGPLMLLAAGAAIGGALLTMAILGRTTNRNAGAPVVPSGRVQVAGSAAKAPPPALLPRWSQAHEDRWISNHPRSVAWEIDAAAPVAIWMRHVRPMLVVRCLATSTDVFVFTDSAARIEPRDERHTVRVGFDDEPEVTERWPDSADHDALFAPDGVMSARRLAGARSMRFTFTPHNADPVTARFDVAGFDAIASGMAKTCGWK